MKRNFFFIFIFILVVAGIGYSVFFDAGFHSYSPEKFRGLTLTEQIALFDSWSGSVDFQSLQTFLYERAYPDERYDIHPLVHKLGEIAVTQNGFDGFSLCSGRSQYGCFHGAAIELIHTHGLDDTTIESMVRACEKTSYGAGHCMHGVGHALTVLSGYDVPGSYEQCDDFVADSFKTHCYRGVSMENTTHLTERQYDSFSFSNKAHDCRGLNIEYQKECVDYYIISLVQEENMSLQESVSHCLSYENPVDRICIASASAVLFRMSDDISQSLDSITSFCGVLDEHGDACLFGIARYFYSGNDLDMFSDVCGMIDRSSVWRSECESVR